AADLGPLAAYMVSGHFSALLDRFSSHWKNDETLKSLVAGFLAEQRDQREQWLVSCQKTLGERGDRAAVDRAVGWLQMFDWMSLWLCCAERSDSEPFSAPDGTTLTFRPAGGPYEVEVAPWPFRAAALTLEVVGRSVPATRYANPSDLVTAAAEAKTLKWVLRPR